MPTQVLEIYLTGDSTHEWQHEIKARFPKAHIRFSALPSLRDKFPLGMEDTRPLLETAGDRVRALLGADVVIGKTSEDPLCQALLNAEFGLARGRSPDTLIFLVGPGEVLDRPQWVPAAMLASEAHDSLKSLLDTLEESFRFRHLQ